MTGFERAYNDFMAKYELACAEIGKIVVGLDDFIRDVFVVILGRGHMLLESAPGLGKTTTIEAIASTVDARFVKTTFNANIMPDDLTHITYPHETGLKIDRGPLLGAEIFFANELNRGPEKTQSYLMSAMEEGESYYRGELVKLPDFRCVIADINPIETTGTYQIPEALAERFMLKQRINFPEHANLAKIVAFSEDKKIYGVPINKVFSTKELLDYSKKIFELYRAYSHERSWLVGYSSAIVEWIRESGFVVLDTEGLPASPSPRGAEDIKTVARLYAFFDGEPVILPKHVKRAASPALRGKFFLNRDAIAGKLTHDEIIAAALSKIPISGVRR